MHVYMSDTENTGTTIRVGRETHAELWDLKNEDESLDDVIQRVLAESDDSADTEESSVSDGSFSD